MGSSGSESSPSLTGECSQTSVRVARTLVRSPPSIVTGVVRWTRRRGLFDRRDPVRPSLRYVNDGGRDAPMDPKSNRIWWAIAAGIIIVSAAAILGSALLN
jgi:hypothetical protein